MLRYAVLGLNNPRCARYARHVIDYATSVVRTLYKQFALLQDTTVITVAYTQHKYCRKYLCTRV